MFYLYLKIKKSASELGTGDDSKDCDLIHAFISYILKRWAKELNARSEQVKRSARGKLQAGMHKQTVEHLSPLMRSLEKHSVNTDIRVYLTNITKFAKFSTVIIHPSHHFPSDSAFWTGTTFRPTMPTWKWRLATPLGRWESHVRASISGPAPPKPMFPMWPT
jgi:hypothetical protein